MCQRRAHSSSCRSPVRQDLLPPGLPERRLQRKRCGSQAERRTHPTRQGCHRDRSTARFVLPTFLQKRPRRASAALDAHEQRTQLRAPMRFVAKLQEPIGWLRYCFSHPFSRLFCWFWPCCLRCSHRRCEGWGCGLNLFGGSVCCPTPKSRHRHPPPVPGSGGSTRVPFFSCHPNGALGSLNVGLG